MKANHFFSSSKTKLRKIYFGHFPSLLWFKGSFIYNACLYVCIEVSFNGGGGSRNSKFNLHSFGGLCTYFSFHCSVFPFNHIFTHNDTFDQAKRETHWTKSSEKTTKFNGNLCRVAVIHMKSLNKLHQWANDSNINSMKCSLFYFSSLKSLHFNWNLSNKTLTKNRLSMEMKIVCMCAFCDLCFFLLSFVRLFARSFVVRSYSLVFIFDAVKRHMNREHVKWKNYRERL